ncbi:helix-turn-helix domain-containing protein [Hydrocarboniphaga effusa]|jgi:transcriptional regulator with XRE-family HTH domain
MSKLSTDYLNIEIGARLIGVRTKLGYTQPDFAAHLGLSYRAYGNYERGEREMPTALFRHLCDKFQIDPLWLLRGPGTEPVLIGSRQLDQKLLSDIMRLVEEWLERHDATLRCDKKAQLISLAYQRCSQAGAVDALHLQDMLSMAA